MTSPSSNLESSSDESKSSSSSDEDEAEAEDATKYTRTDPAEWEHIAGRRKGTKVTPVPYTGEHEDFSVVMTEEEFNAMLDEEGNLRYDLVFEWLLPTFGPDGDITFFKFVAARMRNYIVHIMKTTPFKPAYYAPLAPDPIVITADHVARFSAARWLECFVGFLRSGKLGPHVSR